MRGQPMPAKEFNARDDEAACELIALLTDMPPEIAESLVQGLGEEDQFRTVPIDAGIWRLTAATESKADELLYRLIGIDDSDENEGAILGPQRGGYRMVQIRAHFIAENRPETTLAIAPVKSRAAVAKVNIQRTIESVIAQTPEELEPLANSEIENLVRQVLPDASRDVVREIISEIQPAPKRGPKGPRQPERKQKLKEFGERFLAAKLQI
jgi:hypothetical protein